MTSNKLYYDIKEVLYVKIVQISMEYSEVFP